MTRTQAKQFLTFDRISAILGFVIVIAGLGVSIGLFRGELKTMEAAVKAITKDVANVRLDFIAADVLVASVHSTQFRRLDTDVSDVRRNVGIQAVSIGKIEAGVEYIVNNIDGN